MIWCRTALGKGNEKIFILIRKGIGRTKWRRLKKGRKLKNSNMKGGGQREMEGEKVKKKEIQRKWKKRGGKGRKEKEVMARKREGEEKYKMDSVKFVIFTQEKKKGAFY